MSVLEAWKAEWAGEAAVTRRVLERVPEADFGWKPHEKSMSMVQLASHIVDIPSWVEHTFNADELVFDPATFKPWFAASSADLLEAFDRHSSKAVEVLSSQSEDVVGKIWTLKMLDKVVLQMPKAAVLRAFVFSHLIHHRGQLSVYLRLRDIPVPSIYGPSADEGSF